MALRFFHVHRSVRTSPALLELKRQLGVSTATAIGLVLLRDPRVEGWMDQHRDLVRMGPMRVRRPGRTRRRDIPRRVRLAVYERDGFRCVLCGAVDQLTLDHVVFHSHGGTDDASNLRTACHTCNSRRQPLRQVAP